MSWRKPLADPLHLNLLFESAFVLTVLLLIGEFTTADEQVIEIPPNVPARPHFIGVIHDQDPDEFFRIDIVIQVSRQDGKIRLAIEHRPVELVQLGGMLKRLRAEAEDCHLRFLIDASGVEWETVFAVIDAARGAGIESLGLLARRDDQTQ